MTPQEIEKTIEFLLQHQATVEARQDKTDRQIAELVEQNKAMLEQTRAMSVAMNDQDRRFAERFERIADGLQVLKDVCRDLLDNARWTDARIRRLEQPEG